MKTRCTRKPRQASAKNRFSALARARCCPKMWKTLCWYADAHRFSGKSGNGSLPPFFTRSITIGFPPECGCESCLEYFPQDARRNVRDLPCGFCTRHTRKSRNCSNRKWILHATPLATFFATTPTQEKVHSINFGLTRGLTCFCSEFILRWTTFRLVRLRKKNCSNESSAWRTRV